MCGICVLSVRRRERCNGDGVAIGSVRGRQSSSERGARVAAASFHSVVFLPRPAAIEPGMTDKADCRMPHRRASAKIGRCPVRLPAIHVCGPVDLHEPIGGGPMGCARSTAVSKRGSTLIVTSRHRLAEAATPLRRRSAAHAVEPAANSEAEQTAQAMHVCAYSPQHQACYCFLARSCAESPQCFDSKSGAAVPPRWRVAVGPPPVSSGRRYRVDQPAPNEVHRRPTGNLSFD